MAEVLKGMLLEKALPFFVVGLLAPLGVAHAGFDRSRDAEAKAEQARAAAANQFEAAISEQRARDAGLRPRATDAPILAPTGTSLLPGEGLSARRAAPPAESKVAAAPAKHRVQHRNRAPKAVIARASRKTGGR